MRTLIPIDIEHLVALHFFLMSERPTIFQLQKSFWLFLCADLYRHPISRIVRSPIANGVVRVIKKMSCDPKPSHEELSISHHKLHLVRAIAYESV